jgi:hypothetical protein
VDHWIDFRLALKIDLRGRPDCPSGPPREIKGLDLSQATSQKLAVVSAWGSDRFEPMSGTRLNVCALGDRRGSGGGVGARAPCRHHGLLRREDCLGPRSTQREGARMSLFRTADRIDYSIRRYIHATDHLWSPPHAIRRSRANGAPQSKLIPAPDRSVWLSIGHYLRVQYDALSAPVPLHITALVEQLETKK